MITASTQARGLPGRDARGPHCQAAECLRARETTITSSLFDIDFASVKPSSLRAPFP